MKTKSKILFTCFALLLLTGCSFALEQGIAFNTVPSNIDSNQIGVYFPRAGQDPSVVLSGLYSNSLISIDCAIYSLTKPNIVKALGDAKKRGVQVRVITDNQQAGGKSQTVAIDDLILLGIPVKSNTHSGLMHLKMSIIDGLTATTGSYNYSTAASTTNDEMFVVVTEQGFVKRCQDEFNRLWNSPIGFELRKISY